MDLFPTFAALSGGAVPADRTIDGHNICSLMFGEPGAKSPTQAFFFYQHTHLQGVRDGKWKLLLPRPAKPPWCPDWSTHIDPKDVIEIKKPILFDLESDVGETTDVAAAHAEVVERLLNLAETARDDIGDYDRIGKNARFFSDNPKRPDTKRWSK